MNETKRRRRLYRSVASIRRIPLGASGERFLLEELNDWYAGLPLADGLRSALDMSEGAVYLHSIEHPGSLHMGHDVLKHRYIPECEGATIAEVSCWMASVSGTVFCSQDQLNKKKHLPLRDYTFYRVHGEALLPFTMDPSFDEVEAVMDETKAAYGALAVASVDKQCGKWVSGEELSQTELESLCKSATYVVFAGFDGTAFMFWHRHAEPA